VPKYISYISYALELVCVCVWSLLGVACLFQNTWHTECGPDVDKMGTHTPVCVCVCVCVC
jgi:hypothetical protein